MSATRPITELEREVLATRAAGSRPLASFMASAWGMAFATLFAAFLLLGVPLALTGVDFAAWPTQDLLILGLAAIFAFWTAIALRNYRRHRARIAPLEAALRADLAGGVAEVERYHAVDALRVIAPERGERAYFVRLDDGRVLFVGYWNPPEDGISAEGPEADGFPAIEFEIARAPRSRMVLNVAGCGESLAPSQTFMLGQRVVEQGRLAEVGALVDVPWESIPQAFGSDA